MQAFLLMTLLLRLSGGGLALLLPWGPPPAWKELESEPPTVLPFDNNPGLIGPSGSARASLRRAHASRAEPKALAAVDREARARR